MKSHAVEIMCSAVVLPCGHYQAPAADNAQFHDLFNGKFVNGVSNVSVKKGHLCLESEGAEIHFRNIRIMELPPGIASAEQTAPVVED